MSRATDTVTSLKELVKKQADLVQELDDSVTIGDFWSEAFKHGACTESIVGGPSQGYRFRITQGNGEWQEWPITIVPHRMINSYLRRTNISLKADRSLSRALKQMGFEAWPVKVRLKVK